MLNEKYKQFIDAEKATDFYVNYQFGDWIKDEHLWLTPRQLVTACKNHFELYELNPNKVISEYMKEEDTQREFKDWLEEQGKAHH